MKKVVVIAKEQLGGDNAELGSTLMRLFLMSLVQADSRPEKIIFMNEGVKLACQGSPVLSELEELAELGVAFSSCGTCLDFLKLRENLAVGEAGTMPSSVAAMMGAKDTLFIG